MSRRFKFTKASLVALLPTGKQCTYRDTESHLALYITPAGSKIFCVYIRVDDVPRRITIERFDPTANIQLERLRARAAEIRSDAKGVVSEASAQKLTDKITLRSALTDAIETKGKRTLDNPKGRKQSTIDGYWSIVNAYAKDWLDRPIDAITREDIANRHRRVTKDHGPRVADRLFDVLRLTFNFAIAKYRYNRRPLIKENPCDINREIKLKHGQRRRKIVIPQDKLGVWLRAVLALENHIPLRKKPTLARTICVQQQLALFTGFRPGETYALEWSQFDLDRGTISFTDEQALKHIKNGEAIFNLPMNDYLLFVLRNWKMSAEAHDVYLFPNSQGNGPITGNSVQDWKDRLASTVGISLHQHALRNTFLSIAEAVGVNFGLAKKLVNHTQWSGNDVTEGYIYSGVNVLKDASNRIAQFILEQAALKFDGKAVLRMNGEPLIEDTGD